MSSFDSPLILTPYLIDDKWDGKNWWHVEDFLFTDEVFGAVRIPKGFVTDGGSVPAVFTNIIRPLGLGVRAFVAHDWEYGTQTHTREDADKMLFRLLRLSNFDEVEDGIIYDALRLGGEAAWNGDKANIDKNLALLKGP